MKNTKITNEEQLMFLKEIAFLGLNSTVYYVAPLPRCHI